MVGTWQVLLNFLTSNVTGGNLTPARKKLSGLDWRKKCFGHMDRQHAVGRHARINGDVQTDGNTEYNVAVQSVLDD
jgi:hypothetical protein